LKHSSTLVIAKTSPDTLIVSVLWWEEREKGRISNITTMIQSQDEDETMATTVEREKRGEREEGGRREERRERGEEGEEKTLF